MSDYYDRQGQPIDPTTWAIMFEDTEGRIVAKTRVGEATVSTVWLGLDHNFVGGPPLIFETMVFGGPLDQDQERYSTEAQALAGHEQMVARVRGCPEEFPCLPGHCRGNPECPNSRLTPERYPGLFAALRKRERNDGPTPPAGSGGASGGSTASPL